MTKPILIVILVSAFFRFYNLSWGAPFYFHPDEQQNIVYPILESRSPFLIDQQNFDSGTLPLLIIKSILSLVLSFSFLPFDRFSSAIIISRFLSATISILILIAIFFIAKKIFNQKTAFIALFLSLFSVGFIQFSHFGTVELWEALLFLILFFLSFKISKNINFPIILLAGVLTGIAISTKILSALIIPAVFSSFLVFIIPKRRRIGILKSIKKFCLFFILYLLISSISFLLTSPQFILHFNQFKQSIQYEGAVTTGKILVFYTQSFINTWPVLFQFTKSFPFLLNPLLTILFVPSLIYVFIKGKRNKDFSLILLGVFFTVLFLSQALFFAKWTRYLIPLLPLMYLILAVGIADGADFVSGKIHRKNLALIIKSLIIFISFIFSVSFFVEVYVKPNTVITAANFAKKNIRPNKTVLSEAHDLGIVPFNNYFRDISLFNFYDLENNPGKKIELEEQLKNTDYIILPSQRLFKSRIINKDRFPDGFNFYSKLFSEKLGFKKIYETPCDIFCKVTYLGNPVFNFEETTNVFDRPTVYIFKKSNINNQ